MSRSKGSVLGKAQAVGAVAGRHRRQPFKLQMQQHELADVRVVLDDKDPAARLRVGRHLSSGHGSSLAPGSATLPRAIVFSRAGQTRLPGYGVLEVTPAGSVPRASQVVDTMSPASDNAPYPTAG